MLNILLERAWLQIFSSVNINQEHIKQTFFLINVYNVILELQIVKHVLIQVIVMNAIVGFI